MTKRVLDVGCDVWGQTLPVDVKNDGDEEELDGGGWREGDVGRGCVEVKADVPGLTAQRSHGETKGSWAGFLLKEGDATRSGVAEPRGLGGGC